MSLPKSDFAAFWYRSDISTRAFSHTKGRKLPLKTREHMRLSALGHVVSESTKKKIAQSKIGILRPKISAAKMGHKVTIATRQKLSHLMLNYLQNNPEERKRIVNQLIQLRKTSREGWSPDRMSWLERKMLKLLGEARIKGFLHNYEVEGSDGRTYFIDYAFPELAIAIECDSKAFHSTRVEKARDAERQRYLEEEGWTFVRFSSEQILKNPEEVKKVLKEVVGKTAKARKYSLTP